MFLHEISLVRNFHESPKIFPGSPKKLFRSDPASQVADIKYYPALNNSFRGLTTFVFYGRDTYDLLSFYLLPFITLRFNEGPTSEYAHFEKSV